MSLSTVSLRGKVLNGSIWRLAGYFASQGLRFASNLLMTRLLLPESFGIMGLAMIVFVALQMFSDVGLKQAIIQSDRGDDARFLNTAWSIQIARGLVLWGISLSLAFSLLTAARLGFLPPGSAYSNPALPFVIISLSSIAVIDGFNSTKLHQATRRMLFNRITKLELISQIAGLACTWLWVFFDRSLWALVAGTLCSSGMVCLMSHLYLPGQRNRWIWDQIAAKEIFTFGKWIVAASMFGFLISNGDRILLGALVDSTTLGIYVIAFTLYSAIEQLITKLIADIFFPALSEVARERPKDLPAVYGQAFVIAGCGIYFTSGVLWMIGGSIVSSLYSAQYADAGWILQTLALGLLATPYYLTANCFLAVGLSRLYAQLIAVRALLLFVLVPLGFMSFGLFGAVCSIVISYFSALPLVFYHMCRHHLFRFSHQVMLVASFAFAALLAQIVLILA